MGKYCRAKALNVRKNWLINTNPFRYRSYYYDVETQLYYLQCRYYNSNICRFLSSDDVAVLGVEQSNVVQYNLFVYCLNNPVNYMDENGYISISAIIGAIIGLGTAVTTE